MAELKGTNLSSSIVPFTTEDTFATHLAKFGKGGWRSVADTAERDGITADRREAGMAVYVVAEKKVYILSDDLTTWTDLQTGGGDLGYTKDEIDGFLAAIEAQIDANADAIQKTREDYAQADADIMTIINAHAEQITTNKNNIDDLGDQVAEIEAKIPESASETNQLVTQTDLTNKKIEIMGEVNETVSELQTQITAQATAIEGKVDKAGDTMTGTLNVPELNVATDEGTINLSITAGTATIATNNGLDIVAQTKFDTAPTTDDTTAWADVNATALVTKQQVTTALAGAGGGAGLPDQTGNNGKFLMTDGSNASWEKALKNNATGENYLAVGKDAYTYEEETYGNGIAIGTTAKAWALGGTVVGAFAEANVQGGVVIGENAKVNNFDATTINDAKGVAVGTDAQSTNAQAISIGGDSVSSGVKSIAIGSSAVAGADGAIQLGEGTNSTADTLQFKDKTIIKGDGTVPYERLSTATPTAGQVLKYDGDSDSLVWGAGGGGGSAEYPDQTDNAGKFLMTDGTDVSWQKAIQNNATADGSLAIGQGSGASYSYSIAIGSSTTASGNRSIAIGFMTYVYKFGGTDQIVIGPESRTISDYAIALGTKAIVDLNSSYSIAAGYNAKVKSQWSVAIGYNAQALSHDQVVIGPNAIAAGKYAVAIGHNSTATEEGSIQLGQGENAQQNTLQFREFTLVKEDGVIPPERLSSEPPAEGFTLVYDGRAGELRWAKVDGGGGMSEVNWGDITGSLTNQTDLNTELQNIHSGIQDLEQDFSTSTRKLESDIQDAESRLQTQIDSLSAIGQFLAIWDCDTHNARYLDDGFEYQVGNYFIIGSVAGEGGVNYMPDGPTYSSTGFAVTTEDVKVSDMWFYDGEHWIYLANHERAIAVDADLDVNSTNPVENKAVATAIEELQNRPTGVGVPQLASVDIDQIKTIKEANERRLKYEEWKGRYSDIIVTLNLSKQDLLDKMYDLYITISRFKSNKNLTYQVDEQDYKYRQLSKFSVMNDMRIKTDMRLYCWRFVVDSSLPFEDERRWAYFYTRSNYADVQELLDENPNVGLWYDYGDSPVGYATCFNAVGWYYGYDAQTYYDDFNDGGLERYEAGDISEFANVKDSNNFDYNVADYVTKMHCRKYTKDGQNYFFWSASWKAEDNETVFAYLEDGALVPNGIPKHMDMLSAYTQNMTRFVAQGFELVENRPDLNYRQLIDPNMLIEALQEITFRGYGFGSDVAPYWHCYWFDYPVMPVMLKDCQVRIHTDVTNQGRWLNLDELVKKGKTDLLRDDMPLELKLPYDTYYLWMRFLSLQKRCAYGDPSGWNDGTGINGAMYPYQKHNLREGVVDYAVLNQKAFGRPRSAYRNSEYSKVCEYIQFNVCTPIDVASGSKSKATPIQKRLYITKTAQSGLRD